MEHDDGGIAAVALRLANRRRDVHAVFGFDVGLLHRRIGFTHHVDVLVAGHRGGAPRIVMDLAEGNGGTQEDGENSSHDEVILHCYSPIRASAESPARPRSRRTLTYLARRK